MSTVCHEIGVDMEIVGFDQDGVWMPHLEISINSSEFFEGRNLPPQEFLFREDSYYEERLLPGQFNLKCGGTVLVTDGSIEPSTRTERRWFNEEVVVVDNDLPCVVRNATFMLVAFLHHDSSGHRGREEMTVEISTIKLVSTAIPTVQQHITRMLLDPVAYIRQRNALPEVYH